MRATLHVYSYECHTLTYSLLALLLACGSGTGITVPDSAMSLKLGSLVPFCSIPEGNM